MTTTRKLIIAFWVFIIAMLIWQFYSYNSGMTKDAIEHPQQEHFFFYHSNASAQVTAPAKKRDGADVVQTSFTIQPNKPSVGYFTCLVTVQNKGTAKATNIQVQVRPFKGSKFGDEDVGPAPKPLSDTDPLSQLGEYVEFPDLAPGDSATATASFLSKVGYSAGTNPNPEITFQSEKSKPKQKFVPIHSANE